MALRKLMLLPIAALFFAGVVFDIAAQPEEPVDQFQPEPTDNEAVAATLAEGEAALTNLLGPQVHTLDAMLKPVIRDMAKTYGVSEEELAHVAKRLMEKISTLDVNVIQELMSQMAIDGKLDLEDPKLVSLIMGKLLTEEQKEDEI